MKGSTFSPTVTTQETELVEERITLSEGTSPVARLMRSHSLESCLLAGLEPSRSMLTAETKASPVQPEKREPSKSLVRKLTLYAVLPPQTILSQLDSGFVAEPSDKATALMLWQKASQAYNSHGSPDRSILTSDDIREAKDVDSNEIERVLNQAKLYPPHDSHPTGIYNVRISKLVTPQISVNVSRAEKRASLRTGMSTSELFMIMFESAGKPDPITRQSLGMSQNSGTLLFTSYDEDIRLHHPPT